MKSTVKYFAEIIIVNQILSKNA